MYTTFFPTATTAVRGSRCLCHEVSTSSAARSLAASPVRKGCCRSDGKTVEHAHTHVGHEAVHVPQHVVTRVHRRLPQQEQPAALTRSRGPMHGRAAASVSHLCWLSIQSAEQLYACASECSTRRYSIGLRSHSSTGVRMASGSI